MIQRVQTVYLFIVFCLTAPAVFVPFSPWWVISVMSGTAAGLALITIFLYKRRWLQIKICCAILIILFSIYVFHLFFDRHDLTVEEIFKYRQPTFYLPSIATFFIYLAIYRIYKDEKLIRSLDRLR